MLFQRHYLVAVGFLIVIFSLLVVAIMAGTLASDLMAEYAGRIKDWAWPLWP